tara:strand:- start:2330 stop:3763 length:1434 start_codon:yes stop_codon:yes gene_type:complete
MSISLLDHQKKVVEIARENKRYAFFHEPGLGKTISMLSVCKDRPMPTLVLCPRSIMESAWKADADKLGDIKVGIYHGSSVTKRKLRDAWSTDMPDVVITTFETFRLKKNELLSMGFRRIIVDESSKLKNPNSKISKAAIEAADELEEAYILSGTPAPNNPSEYWAQLRFLGKQFIFTPSGSTNFWAWSSYWLLPVKRKIRVPGRKRGEKVTKEVIATYQRRSDRADAFSETLNKVCWFLAKEECMDLPDKVYQNIGVQLSRAETKLYNDIVDGLGKVDTDGPASASVAANVMKLRQVTGGNVNADEWRDVGKSKIEAMLELMETLAGHPVVIWGEFRFEIERIHETLTAKGYKGAILYGGSKDIADVITQFQAGELDYLVCHPAAVGHGITLTRASHAIYYSLGYSYEQHQQSLDRIHRVGQTSKCTYYYLLANDTIDSTVQRVLRSKADNSSALIAIVKSLAGTQNDNDNDNGECG